MDNGKKVLIWVAGFVGVFLLYSAFKNRTPLSQFRSYIDKSQTPTAISTPNTEPVSVGGNTPAPEPVAPHLALSSYVGDMGGEPYVFDGNGNPVRQVPAVYAQNPGLYVPGNVPV